MRDLTTKPKGSRTGVWSGALRWAARLAFAGACLALVLLLAGRVGERRTKAGPIVTPGLRMKPLVVDWAREPFAEWQSLEDGVGLLYPTRFEPVRGLGRFTSRNMEGGITETDLVAFRSMEPRSVIVLAAYRAPRSLSWSAWSRLARAALRSPPAAASAPASLAAEFGSSSHGYREVRAGARRELRVSAEGAERFPSPGEQGLELWRFESRFLAQGRAALRLTAGVHEDHYRTALPGIKRVLDSLRWDRS